MLSMSPTVFLMYFSSQSCLIFSSLTSLRSKSVIIATFRSCWNIREILGYNSTNSKRFSNLMMVSFDSLRSFPRVRYARNSPARALLLSGDMIHCTATEVEGGLSTEVWMEGGSATEVGRGLATEEGMEGGHSSLTRKN